MSERGRTHGWRWLPYQMDCQLSSFAWKRSERKSGSRVEEVLEPERRVSVASTWIKVRQGGLKAH